MFKYKAHMELKVTLKFPSSCTHVTSEKYGSIFICIFNKFAILEWFQGYGKFAEPVQRVFPIYPRHNFPYFKILIYLSQK